MATENLSVDLSGMGARTITAVCAKYGITDSQASLESHYEKLFKEITKTYEGEVAANTAHATAVADCKTAEDLAESEITIV